MIIYKNVYNCDYLQKRIYLPLSIKMYIFVKNINMFAILTGDIINSREVKNTAWLPILKEELNKIGSSPIDWEIYRGDSFQIKTTAEKALKTALLLKSSIKMINNLDIRIGIGLGEISFQSDKITESNGEAFINSGSCFENLKKHTLHIKSPSKSFDTVMNLLLEAINLTTDNWSKSQASYVKASLENPNKTQKELAKLLDKRQSYVSIGLKRAGFDEVEKILNFYTNQIKLIC